MQQVTVNADQRLYVIPAGGGYSTLGFDVAFNRALAVCKELNLPADQYPDAFTIGTPEGYAQYERAIEAARQHFGRTNQRLTCELTRQLVGLEGRRVEVVDRHGEKRRFQVGRSTGFIPVHLEVVRRTSRGGLPVTGAPFRSVTIIR